MVVRGCPLCGDASDVGSVFRVTDVSTVEGMWGCCHLDDGAEEMGASDDDQDDAYPLRILKRIPPLEELDDVKRDETIEA